MKWKCEIEGRRKEWRNKTEVERKKERKWCYYHSFLSFPSSSFSFIFYPFILNSSIYFPMSCFSLIIRFLSLSSSSIIFRINLYFSLYLHITRFMLNINFHLSFSFSFLLFIIIILDSSFIFTHLPVSF